MQGGAELGQRLRRFFGAAGAPSLTYNSDVPSVILLGDATLPGNNVYAGRRWGGGQELAATPSRVHFFAPTPSAGGVAGRADEAVGIHIEQLVLSAAVNMITAATAPEVRVGCAVVAPFASVGQQVYTERPADIPAAPASFARGGANVIGSGTTDVGGQIICKPYLNAGESIVIPLNVFCQFPTPSGIVTETPSLWVNNFAAGTLSVWAFGRMKGIG